MVVRTSLNISSRIYKVQKSLKCQNGNGVTVLWWKRRSWKKTFFWNLPSISHYWARFDSPLIIYFMYLVFKVGGDGHLNPLSPRVTNINFLLTILIHDQEKRLEELRQWCTKEKCFDLLSGSLNYFYKAIYGH